MKFFATVVKLKPGFRHIGLAFPVRKILSQNLQISFYMLGLTSHAFHSAECQ